MILNPSGPDRPLGYQVMKAKRYIWLWFAALVAVVAGSCIRLQDPEGDGWTPLEGDRPVYFSSSLATPATKANLQTGTSFGVFAYYTKTSNWNSVKTSTTPNFMYNQEVTYNGSAYTYTPLKYWPNNTGDKVTFWAYYPYTASPILFKLGTSNPFDETSKNIPDIRFTVSDGTTDFMVSDLAPNKTKPAVADSVLLTFNHTLSKISFYVKKIDAAVPEKYTVKLKTIRFDDIYLAATYNNYTSGWADYGNSRGSVPAFAPDDPDDYLTLTTSFPVEGSPQVVSMLLPQDLSYQYAMLRVEYTIDFEGLLNTRNMISYIPLSTVIAEASAQWQKGKEYKVNISITPDDPIEFSVTWSNWGQVHNIHITS